MRARSLDLLLCASAAETRATSALLRDQRRWERVGCVAQPSPAVLAHLHPARSARESPLSDRAACPWFPVSPPRRRHRENAQSLRAIRGHRASTRLQTRKPSSLPPLLLFVA